MSEEFAPFWMVYGFGQGSPTYRHASEAKAIAEASRLAGLHPNVKFCVMSSSFVVEKRTVSIKKKVGDRFIDIDITDDIPF